MNKITRLLRHSFYFPSQAQRFFPAATLQRITQAIDSSEREHRGEIRFVVEHALDATAVWKDITPRQQAEAVFSELRVWDTEDNSGVLLYILLAEQAIEIVADRGILQRIEQPVWDSICQQMQHAFRKKQFEQGVLDAIATLHTLLVQHFPAGEHNPNELPNTAILR